MAEEEALGGDSDPSVSSKGSGVVLKPAQRRGSRGGPTPDSQVICQPGPLQTRNQL